MYSEFLCQITFFFVITKKLLNSVNQDYAIINNCFFQILKYF